MAAEETDIIQLTSDFHSLYRTFHLKKNEKKQLQRRERSRPRNRQKTKVLQSDSITTTLPVSMPKIEVLGNCSIFAAYACVRQIVLEFNFADSCRKWLIPLEDTDGENDNAGERQSSPVPLPKIVGIGLEGVFQLIQESHSLHPTVCVKALDALLNILEGQHPQSLKKEPIPVIDSMFTMLLTLSKYEDFEIPSSSKKIHSSSSQLSSLATACLISLAIARGETKSMLEAIASLFMCRDSLASQELKNPDVLKSLQRSTQAILVGRPVLPQWLSHGIPYNSCIDSFSIPFPPDPPGCVFSAKALASNGRYLFLHCSRGLFKIGSGCFGTVRGRIYCSNTAFHLSEKVWLGWAKNVLYYRVLNPVDNNLHILDQNTLEVTESVDLSGETAVTMFSDGVNIGMILPSKEDGFLVRTMCTESYTMESLNEFNLRLVRKSVEVAGPCPWDSDSVLRPIMTGVDDDVATITAGKDFALLRTQHGRILYCGKGASLGQKSGIAKCSKWLELGLTKCPRFVQCAVGHEGIHALLLAEDGTAYFVGTPKRGEDGDQAKLRRVAKASKPKKVIRMEGHDVVYVACNNGTSAFVTRSGDVYMYGKDTAHCDQVSGYVMGLRGVFISQIAMGKAHSILLSGDGKVYTMGINNRGQCGRSLLQPKDDGTDVLEDDDGEWDEAAAIGAVGGPVAPEQEGMCPSGSHRWKHEQCMVCTICRECTGYGSACISALRPDRNPGQECGCGVGDAGCAECGSCRTCAREGIEDQDYLVMDAQRIVADPGVVDLIHLEDDRLLPPEEPPERRTVKPISSAQKLIAKTRGKESSMTSFPPNRLNISTTYPVTHVACGLHHSVFLDTKGCMFVCGSNTFGQLGVGDLAPRHTPTKVRFPDAATKIIQIAAGSYHTVALDSNGVVYTCGSHTKGQLARESERNVESLWFTRMVALDNIGSLLGRRVTWIGATGDSTFIRLEASLISPKLLRKSTVTANSSSIMIIPPPNTGKLSSTIMINRRDGCCTYFDGEVHLNVNTSAAVLDPVYDFLWSFEWRKHLMKCHNVIASAIKNPQCESNTWLTKPPNAIPVAPGSKIQRWQAGASMLACMDTLVAAHIQGLSVHHEEQAAVPVLAKMYSKDDYSAVCRFESHGGGWGYSGHSIEAIRFACDSDILLGGFGLFGGRGEYCAKIKIYDIGPEGGELENDGELLAETEEIPYDCGPRQKFRMMFDEPIALQASRWYVAWAHISGPSSDCGSSGQNGILTEDHVMFHFKSSKKSNNGTDVNAGQIPQILYRPLNSDSNSLGSKPKQQIEPTHLLANDFVSNFTPGSVQVLMSLIGWCWEEIQTMAISLSGNDDVFKYDLMKFISCSCLRLIEFSINQVYPYKGCGRLGQMENLSMAEAIGDVRSMLQRIISFQIEPQSESLTAIIEDIMTQCCSTFVHCFQVFYPTSALKWECLANFMFLYLEKGSKYARMLSSVVGALCGCRGQLLGIFPVLNTIVRQSPDETSLTFVTNTEGGKLKQPANNRLLVGQMAQRNVAGNFVKTAWSFWDVLKHLLSIVDMDNKDIKEPLKLLVHNSSMLLAKLMEELVSHASGVYAELESVIGQIIVATPSRFTRTNQSRTWNTGNGSPDAVCFTVDQPGVSVFGACIYSGTGTYEYELELFQEVDEANGDNCDQPGPKWVSMEVTRGTFDSDDCCGDIAEIRLPRPEHIKPGVKYAIRLKNHGGRTCNGDGGVSILRCPDGTTFTFSSCALSFNGTNQIRGQIPHILYFRNPDDSDARQKAKAVAEMHARKCAQRICTAVFDNAKEVMENVSSEGIAELSNSSLVTTLLPSILSHLPHLALSDPRSSVDLLELIRRILPSVSDLNNKVMTMTKSEKRAESNCSGVHYAWVESEHPYKPATLAHYKVNFPSSVQRMTIEFDPRCCTAQSEDSVRLYIPFGAEVPQNLPVSLDDPDCLSSYIPIMERYTGAENWPQKSIILPGNEVLFSLETASDYARADKSQYFGFRCLVSGFEWRECSGLCRLEMELAYLGGFCAHEMIKKDLVLPPVSAEEVETSLETSICEEKMIEICLKHHPLFAKGIGLEYFPAVQEALDGIVPLREKSKEREFIADFIARIPNTSGERLANWLQPESFVDPQKCEVVASKEAIRRGKPTVLVIVTRDQHAEPVVAHNLQVELKAIPLMTADSGRRQPPPNSITAFGGTTAAPVVGTTPPPPPPPPLPPPSAPPSIRTTVRTSGVGGPKSGSNDQLNLALEVPYQVTVKDKMRYHAITMMKEYENKSFEELRLMSPAARRSSESMLVRQNNNATYTATWTPACTGLYHICLTIDGYSIPQACVIDVEEAPEGTFSTPRKADGEVPPEQSEMQSSKMRKFKATDSAGLRVRSHPSLQSEQIGCLPVDGVISFTQEVHNDDGIWVKLDEASIVGFCPNSQTKGFRLEGWCLQYNQHVGKTFLFPVEGPKSLPGTGSNDKSVHNIRKLTDFPFSNTDNSSKVLRLNGSPGLYQVVKCGVSGHNIRTRPCLRSPPVGILVMNSKFYAVDECYNNEGLWVKLDQTSQRKFCFTSEGEAWSLAVGRGEITYLKHTDGIKAKKGFDFSVASQIPQSLFQNVSPPAAFGPLEASLLGGSEDRLSPPIASKLEHLMDDGMYMKDDVFRNKSEMTSSAESLFQSSKGMKDSSYHTQSMEQDKSHSPDICSRPGTSESPDCVKTPRSRSSSTFGALQKWLQIGSDARPSSTSPSAPLQKASVSVMEVSKSLVKERISALGADKIIRSLNLTTSATQTSPDETPSSSLPTSIHFSIGCGPYQPLGSNLQGPSTAKASPKMERKHKGCSSRARTNRRDKDRAKSPTRQADITALSSAVLNTPAKEAIGPGQAQSLRAVFGAVLWHAGIIHDAMACASYLRFQKHQQQEERTGNDVSKEEDAQTAAATNKLTEERRESPEVMSDDVEQPDSKVDIPPSTEVVEEIQSETDAAVVPEGIEPKSVPPVVMRKKQGSPAKGKAPHQRHSVEVTSAAWYMKENPGMTLEPLDFKSLSKKDTVQENEVSSVEENVVSEGTSTGSKKGGILKKYKGSDAIPNSNTNMNKDEEKEDDKEDEQYPKAMRALEKIWNHIKGNCADTLFKEAVPSSSAESAKPGSVRLRKDKRGRVLGSSEHRSKSKRERPKQLQTMGRSFLLDFFIPEPEEPLEFLDDIQQCEMCQVRFPNKGRLRSKPSSYRKAHFGLSLLCDNCSERQLKIKKQQNILAKPLAASSPLEINLKYLSPTDSYNSHAVMLSNALFLLQMINTVPEGQHQQQYSSVVPLKTTFSCYTALGVTESQVADEDESFYDVNRSGEGKSKKFLEGKLRTDKRSVSSAVTLEDDFAAKYEVSLRRRKASNGDQVPGADESGFTLLSHPSTSLQKVLDAGKGSGENDVIGKMCGSVISFVSEKHDLESLKLYLFQAIRKVTCRSYGMQILAWLMRNVSQPTALHDLLWWYAFSLEYKDEDEATVEKEGLDNGWWQMRSHPLNESPATIFPMLSESFYTLLQTIADIMPFLPVGSPLLEMAVKCWGVCFTRKDHRFLHKSKIFRNLSQIMSQFDGENEWSKSSILLESEVEVESPIEVTTCLQDLTPVVEVKTSSRAALCSSLTDDSTETFWESGDEDRNRTKSITIVSTTEVVVKVIAVHIDNGRDSQYKVSSVAVKVGPHPDEYTKIGHVEIDSRHFGWSWFPIEAETAKVIKIELKGSDNTLRVRQIKVLGLPQDPALEQSDRSSGVATVPVAQRKCENETLRIFRLLSSEVFGKLLNQVKRSEDDPEGNDLQEHVVGILFSRNKLTHLQKQVCSHIVSAIHREAIKIKEEFDSHIMGSVLEATNENVRLIIGEKPKIADRYCFEMLSLVLALAGSKVGRSYLSQQSNLIQDLMQLLHAGTPRIQRQVTLVVRKILPEINPKDFAKIVCSNDVTTGEPRLGILDMLLGCVVKSLQVKVRTAQDGNRSAKNININDIFTSDELPTWYWFLRGEGDLQLANTVVKLIKDMCEDIFSSEWAPVTKPAIADAVLYLTKIDPLLRNSTECLNFPQFWISLASLCVLHADHSKLLSSPVFQNGSTGRAKCANHDDGETLAVIQCHDCGDLCAECDRILHLPKKSWNHVRKVCKEEEESIKVDLHEGCGRIKLFWLMALADSSTLKALIEFRNGIPKTFTDSVSAIASVGRCRFCNKCGNSGPLALGNVCGEAECQVYSRTACERILECGHLCGGVRNETKCLPCLQGCSDKLGTILKQDGDDMCMICFTDALAFAPAIQLLCGHVFHFHCCRSVLESRWAGPRITFSFSLCPICKMEISHILLDDILNPIRELFQDVQRKALMRLEYEGLNKTDAIVSPGGRFYQDPAGFAMDRYAYYVCFKCKKAYFGGEARCDVEIQLEFDPSELVCGGCSDVSQAQLCPKHGTDYLEYKCRYCCSVAVFFCFGTTHFCNGCHDDFQRITAIPKNQLPHCPAGPRAKQLEGEECPLHVSHPPTGEEFALGCGICRNAHTF